MNQPDHAAEPSAMNWLMPGASAAERLAVLAAGNDETVAAVSIREPHVTAAIAASPGAVRRRLAGMFASAAGLEWGSGSFLTVLGGSDPAIVGRYSPTDHRRVDLVVCAGRRILVIVEVKGFALINGGWGYCSTCGPGVYACQLSCYGRHVLEAPEAKRLLVMPNFRTAELKRDLKWYANNDVLVDGWATMSLEALRDELHSMARETDPKTAIPSAALLQLLCYWMWWRIPG